MASSMCGKTPNLELNLSNDLSNYSFIYGGPEIHTFLIFPACGVS